VPNTNRITGPIHKKPPVQDRFKADHVKNTSLRTGPVNTNVTKRVP
jgi:hypothetical protein